MNLAAASSHLVPDQAGALWIHVLLWFLLLGDHRRLLGRRNLILALLTLPALSQFDIMLWEEDLQEPGLEWVLGAAFSCLFATTAALVAWSVLLALTRARAAFEVNVPRRALVVVTALALLLDAAVIFGRPPDDAGYYTSLGSQRWVETGTMPYGDAMLRGPDSPGRGAAATYGPLLYAAHLPFHVVAGTRWNAPAADPRSPEYARAPALVAQLTCLGFHALALAALFALGRRLTTPDNALALVAVYASSAYVVGLGSNGALSCGLVYVSHVAPSAVTLLALLLLRRPAAAGAALSCAAGLLFYPAFLLPAFLGFYAGRGREWRRFAAGFAATGIAIALLVVACTRRLGDQGAVSLFFDSTLEHQEGAAQYGGSVFGFFGTHPALAEVLQRPLVAGSSLLKPSFLLVAAFSVLCFFLARRRGVPQLALLIAAVAAAVQLWKTHAGGTYVMWYLPFLLLGLFGRAQGGPAAPAPDVVNVED